MKLTLPSHCCHIHFTVLYVIILVVSAQIVVTKHTYRWLAFIDFMHSKTHMSIVVISSVLGLVYCVFFPILDLCALITASVLGLDVGAMLFWILVGIVDVGWLLLFLCNKTSFIRFWTKEYDFFSVTGLATHFFRPLWNTTVYLFVPLFLPFFTVACPIIVLVLWSITTSCVLATIP